MKKRSQTKQKLLNILKKDNELKIEEIMAYFTISEIAVRKHLHELEQQGLINVEKRKQQLGRPYHTYSLTKKGHDTFPNQYEKLPLELLRDLEELEGKQAVTKLLSKRMERERKDLEQKIHSNDFEEKVATVAKIQDKKGYMVELKKNEAGDYEMKHYNCPIANIASCYKQMCSNEKSIFEQIFSTSEVISHSCITNGDHCCKWTIKKPVKG
ncbi:helix-turn-helix transcriptional regulator [Oceanobacillus halotolerans]|uniref:helix-turn-helix transcriptional regulator n=1 Tax=Oceanobacillus halotolerans TaxID=2663380 RepID=UPI0013DB1E82|nr:DeoR family transcriptional regulator [Oceanobacillus halotolerans]